LPDVLGTESNPSFKFTKDIQSEQKHDEMLIDDYNVHVKSNFNKLAFKEVMKSDGNRKIMSTNPELKMKRQLREKMNSAIRIIKRQQSKFNMIDDSIMSENSPFQNE
jgi:hypothetical protein